MRLDAHFDLLPLRAFQRGPSGRIKPQGGKGSQKAPDPDPSIGQAQLQLAANAKRQTDLAEQQQKDYNANVLPRMQAQADQANSYSALVADSQIAINKQQLEYSRQYHDRMVNTFYPMQDAAIAQAKNYNTEANQNQIAASAIGDNVAAFEAQRNADATKAKAYGIDPTSGAYQGMQQTSGVAQAATSASAATRARAAAVQLGWGMQMDAIHLGDGLAAASMGSAQTAINAGSSAVASANNGVNNSLAVNSGTNQTYSGTQAGYGGANNAMSASGGLGAQSYGTQVSAWNAQQQANAASSAGIGSAIGGIAGMAMSGGTAGFAGSAVGMGIKALGSDIRLKENIEVVGMTDSGLTIYEFDYKPEFKDSPYAGHGRFRGVMAHEVERVIPSAVFTTPDGYKAVDYSQVI